MVKAEGVIFVMSSTFWHQCGPWLGPGYAVSFRFSPEKCVILDLNIASKIISGTSINPKFDDGNVFELRNHAH